MSTVQLQPVSVAVPATRTITAGDGLVGGGSLAADRTIDAVANADGSIVVNADDIQIGILATDAQHGNRGGALLHVVATGAVAGFMSAADKTALDAHLVSVSNPHTVTQTQAYIAGPTVDLNDTQGTHAIDAAARGIAGDEVDVQDLVDGATVALRVSYDRTQSRAVIKSGAISGIDLESTIFPDRTIISLGFDQLQFLRQDRTIISGSPGFFLWNSVLTLDAAIPLLARSFGGFIDLGGTFQFDASASPFGMGNALLHRATWKNATGVVANLGPSFLFANNAIYQADGATITSSQARIFFDNASYTVINAGVGSQGATGHTSLYSNLTVGAGWALELRRSVFHQEGVYTGTVATQVVVDIPSLTAAATNIGIRSAMIDAAGRWFIQHTGTGRSDFGGIVGLGTGATVDWEISRLAANLATLADGDSLRISTGALLFGATGTVSLISAAANRLDLGTGDSFRIINGTLEHQAGLVGLFGATPIGQSAAYAPTNVTPTRAFDADTVTLAALADVVGTMIADIQALGPFA